MKVLKSLAVLTAVLVTGACSIAPAGEDALNKVIDQLGDLNGFTKYSMVTNEAGTNTAADGTKYIVNYETRIAAYLNGDKSQLKVAYSSVLLSGKVALYNYGTGDITNSVSVDNLIGSTSATTYKPVVSATADFTAAGVTDLKGYTAHKTTIVIDKREGYDFETKKMVASTAQTGDTYIALKIDSNKLSYAQFGVMVRMV